MKESMYKTLSSKYESTVRKIIRKYCRNKVFTVRYENNKGEMLERTIYHGGFKQRKTRVLTMRISCPVIAGLKVPALWLG